MPSIYHRSGGSWTRIAKVYHKASGSWTQIRSVYKKVSGSWVKVFSAGSTSISVSSITQTGATFNWSSTVYNGSYQILISPSVSGFPINFTSSTTSTSTTSLSVNTSYTVTVRAYSGTGQTGSYDTATANFTTSSYYNVTYSANGGSNAPTDSTNYSYADLVTVKTIGSMTRSGYAFASWNTAADGSGTSYNPGNQFYIYNSTTLYAQWSNVIYTPNSVGSLTGTSSSSSYGASWTAPTVDSSHSAATGYWWTSNTTGTTPTTNGTGNQITDPASTSVNVSPISPGTYYIFVQAYNTYNGTTQYSGWSGTGAINVVAAPYVINNPTLSTSACYINYPITCTTSTSDWGGGGTITFAYQWYYKTGTTAYQISGATSATYYPAGIYAVLSNTISCQVTATNSAGSTSFTCPYVPARYTGNAGYNLSYNTYTFTDSVANYVDFAWAVGSTSTSASPTYTQGSTTESVTWSGALSSGYGSASSNQVTINTAGRYLYILPIVQDSVSHYYYNALNGTQNGAYVFGPTVNNPPPTTTTSSSSTTTTTTSSSSTTTTSSSSTTTTASTTSTTSSYTCNSSATKLCTSADLINGCCLYPNTPGAGNCGGAGSFSFNC